MKFEIIALVNEVEVNDVIAANSPAEAKEKFVKAWGRARKVKVKKI